MKWEVIVNEQDDSFNAPEVSDADKLAWWREAAGHTSSNARMLQRRSARINNALRDKYNIKDATAIASSFEMSLNPNFYTEVADGVMLFKPLIQHVDTDPLI